MSGLERQVAEVRALLDDRLGIRGADLSDQLRRAGRLLPRDLRRDGRVLAQAHLTGGHPRLSLQVDFEAATAAAERLTAYLKAVDAGERRRSAFIGRLSVIGFNLLVVAGLLLAVLVWRGLI